MALGFPLKYREPECAAGYTYDVVVDSGDVEGEGVGVYDALVALELVVPVGVVFGPSVGVAGEEAVGAGVRVGSP